MTIDEAMNLALGYHQAGRVAEAEGIYRQVLAVVPGHGGAWMLMGVAALQQKRFAEAIEWIGRSIAVGPTGAAYSNLGEAYRECGRLDEAVQAYREAIRLEPGMGVGYSNLGLALQKLRRFEEAEGVLRKAVELDPGSGAGWQNFCNVLGDVGKTSEAVVAGRRAVELLPGSTGAWSDLGVACVEDGKLAGAKEAFERAVNNDPGWGEAHHNLAQVLLRLGEFEKGWAEYEWRWRCKDFPSAIRNFSQPLWRGEDLMGKTILLYAEQGFGDAMMFARYVPLVMERGAKRVVVECQREIVSLVRSVGDVEVVGYGEALPAFEVQCPFLSLPGVFGTRVERVPARVPYLRAEEEKVEVWKKRLGTTLNTQHSTLNTQKGGMKVGIVWAGRPTHKNDHNRSMKLAQLGRLGMEGVVFYSLQVGPAAGEARETPAGMALVDLSGELTDYSETAAVLENLDLVIAVDTSIVHAAGAMGKEVWVMLPFAGDWRWLGTREDSPWYPTMRLFRQEKWGDWEGVVERVREELQIFRQSR
jgi:tetratricopeptide (TPR) repeat protein